MTEGNYKRALSDALTAEYADMLPQVSVEHIFSPGFEKRMNRLAKRRSHSYYIMINTAAKRVACVFGILFIASFSTVMSVSALREAFIGFFMNVFDKYSIVRTDDGDSAPGTIREIYGITSLPEGYKEVYSDRKKILNNVIYEDGRGNTIDLAQYVKSEFNIGVNTEGADTSSLTVGGQEAIYFTDNHGYSNIIWNNDDYTFYLSTNLHKEEALSLAESVQKVE